MTTESSLRNKHGLSRYIPADVRYAVRKRCGFGCIFCGRAIVQYHHFNPPFDEATLHNPGSITLLCGAHHDEATKGLVSPTGVATADASPAARRKGYAKYDLLFERREPRVRLGTTDFFCQYPIVYCKKVILGFDPPEEPDAPLRLQAEIYGTSGEKIFEIVDNEWRAGMGLFDVVTTANRLEIRESKKELALGLSFSSDRGLTIDTLNMAFCDASVLLNGNTITAKRGGTVHMTLGKVVAEAGIFFPAKGGVVIGASGIPFTERHVAEFGPSNDLEYAMVGARDNASSFHTFLDMLRSSKVFVLAESRGAGSIQATLASRSDGTKDMVIITAAGRVDAIRRRWPVCGAPQAISFEDLLRGMPTQVGIVLNPFSRISLRLDRAKVESLRNNAVCK